MVYMTNGPSSSLFCAAHPALPAFSHVIELGMLGWAEWELGWVYKSLGGKHMGFCVIAFPRP